MTIVPLPYRVPNPPALFEGRKAEVRWMTKMLDRSALVVIAGMGGQGKTALALEVLHRAFADRVPRVIYVRPAAHGESLLAQLWRVLSRVAGIEIPEDVLSADPEVALGALIDVADDGEWWVLIDDTHRLQDPRVESTLHDIARYARHSRWIVTTRIAPGPALRQHLLRLEHLDSAALKAIARAWDPRLSAAELRRVVDASAGSPWRLYQALSGDTLEDLTLLDGVTASQRSLLQVLCVLECDVPLSLLLGVVNEASDEDWSALVRRGLVSSTSVGCRTHDLTRELLQGEGLPEHLHEALCQALLASPEPELQLEGLIQGRQLGHAVLDLLGEPEEPRQRRAIVDVLLHGGLGRELDELLVADRSESRRAELDAVRMRVALHTTDYQQFETIMPPDADSSYATRVLWTRGLFARHLFTRSLQSARDLLDEAVDDEVRLLEASSIAALGSMAEARQRLEAFEAADEAIEVERLELLAMVKASVGDHDGALALANALRPRLSSMHGTALARRSWKLARVYYLLGQLGLAQQVVDRVMADSTQRKAAPYSGRGVLEFRSILALGLGRFDEVNEVQQHLAARTRTPHGAIRDQLRVAQVHLDTGAIDGLQARLRDVAARAEVLGYGDALYSAREKLVQLDILTGSSSTSDHGGDLSAENPVIAMQWRLGRLRLGTLEGQPWTIDADALVTAVDDQPQQRGFARMTKAIALSMSGQHDDAMQVVLSVLHRLRQTGHQVSLVKGLMNACDVAWLAGQREAHAQMASELAALVCPMDSNRFLACADWHRALRSADTIGPATIESLATRADPIAARRALTLMGDPAPLHAWDRMVVNRVLGLREVWRPVQPVEWSPDGPVWGIDFDRPGIWDHEGQWHDYADGSPVFELIRQLVARGGDASKEELVCGIWHESEYHPLKHDNRLRLTVRRLRAALAPCDPIRALDDGYALTGRMRQVGEVRGRVF